MSSLKDKVGPPGKVAHVKGILFGPPKTGKTTAGTSGANTLLVEMDPDGDATASLRDRQDVDVIKPKTASELTDVVAALHGEDKGTWPIVCFDSATSMYNLFAGDKIATVLLQEKDPRRAYQRVGTSMNQVIYDIMALPMHVIVTAHLRVIDTSGEGGTPLNPEAGQYPITLEVSPMIYKELAPSVSFIGRTLKKRYYEVDETTKKRNIVSGHFVSFDDGDRSPAGSRLGLPAEVSDFNMDEIVKFVMKAQGGKK